MGDLRVVDNSSSWQHGILRFSLLRRQIEEQFKTSSQVKRVFFWA
jgi:hypothetical protein